MHQFVNLIIVHETKINQWSDTPEKLTLCIIHDQTPNPYNLNCKAIGSRLCIYCYVSSHVHQKPDIGYELVVLRLWEPHRVISKTSQTCENCTTATSIA